MKTIITILTLLFVTTGYSQTLLQTIDLPSETFYNYGYGLVYENSMYWISSSSTAAGGGIIKAVDSSGIQVDQLSINYPTLRSSQGLAFDGTNFWYVERKTARCDLFKVAPDGTVLDSITTTQLFGGSKYLGGTGWDGTGLWISIYYPNNEAALYKIDVASKTVVDTIQTNGAQPQGITCKGDTLFYVMDDNDGDEEIIYAVDLNTKSELFSFPVPDPSGQSPRGLAWDGTYFWLLAEPVGGSLNQRQLFKYDLGGSGTPEIFIPFTNILFPNTTVGMDTSAILQIFNNGTANLTVDSIKIAGDEFSFDPISFPLEIAPGNSENVMLNFTPADYEFYTGNVKVYSNDPVDPLVQVDLAGQGVLNGQTIGLTSSSHNFGNVWIGGDGIVRWTFGIFNMGDEPLNILNMNFNLPEFSFTPGDLSFTIASTDTTEITLYFYPIEAVGYVDTLKITSNDSATPISFVFVNGTGIFDDYNYGYAFWNYQVPPNPNISFNDYRVEGLKSINDITGDGISEVIIATDNYLLMCLEGAGSGTTFPIWTFNSYFANTNAGSIGQSNDYGVQDALFIASDLNGDGLNDIVIGTGGGNEHVYAIDGTNGEIIWGFGDDVNYSLGDFEAVDASRDYNEDTVPDVLAIADGNEEGSGYHRAYLFDGTNGNIIWQYYYPGPNLAFGKTIISVDDVTGDHKPDAVIAVGNNGSANLKVICLNGTNGQQVWEREMDQYEPKELLELKLPDGTSDVIAAEYFYKIHRLSGETGDPVWSHTLPGSSGVIQINLISDINSDDIDDVLIASFASNGLNCLNGLDGTVLWNYPMNFQYGVAAVPDIDSDGVEDVITGDQDGTFYCISGKSAELIFSQPFAGDRINTVNVLPSIDGNYSYELLAGTLDGKVSCMSGGIDTISTVASDLNSIPDEYQLFQNYPNPFNPATKIKYSVSSNQIVSLRIYDILGSEITTLVNEYKVPGDYEVIWDASGFPSGVYFYKLHSGDFTAIKKMIFLK